MAGKKKPPVVAGGDPKKPERPQGPKGESLSDKAKQEARDAANRARARKGAETRKRKREEELARAKREAAESEWQVDAKELRQEVRAWIEEQREALKDEALSVSERADIPDKERDRVVRRCRAGSLECLLIGHGVAHGVQKLGPRLGPWLWLVVLFLGLVLYWIANRRIKRAIEKWEAALEKRATTPGPRPTDLKATSVTGDKPESSSSSGPGEPGSPRFFGT